MQHSTPITHIYELRTLDGNHTSQPDTSVSTFLKLQEQHKAALSKAEAIGAEMGEESEEYKTAAAETDTLKQKLVTAVRLAGKRFPSVNSKQWWHTDNKQTPKHMTIEINGIQVNIPSSLHEITLGQRIDYAAQYGDKLDQQLKEIEEISDPEEKEIALTAWTQDKMFKEMSFFSGVPLDVLENSGMDESIKDIYSASLAGLIENI